MKKVLSKILVWFLYGVYLLLCLFTWKKPQTPDSIKKEAINTLETETKKRKLVNFSEYQGGKVQVDHDQSQYDVQRYINEIEGKEK